jgi:predicted NodU family carbamoyl transferase
MNILGINFGHDGALAIIKDGKLYKAISRERITRTKKARGICNLSLEYVLKSASLKIEEIHPIN